MASAARPASPGAMPPMSSGMAMFSRAVNSSSRWWNWYTKPSERLRRRERSRSPRPVRLWPSIHTSPSLAASRPPSRCSRVLLPAPDVPMMATLSPAATRRSTPCSTVSAPPASA